MVYGKITPLAFGEKGLMLFFYSSGIDGSLLYFTPLPVVGAGLQQES